MTFNNLIQMIVKIHEIALPGSSLVFIIQLVYRGISMTLG